jgi:hypothetical protein
MSKVVDTVVDTGGDLFGIGRSLFDKTVGALWDSLTPDVPEEDLATLAKGLQKGIDQPRRITFGRDRVGGVIAHQAEIERDKKKFVQMVVLINGAPIDALEEIYIADKPLTEYPSESWDYELSDGRHTTANSKAVAKMAGWTAAHIGYGQAHIFVEFENNREVFPDGISDTEFLIRGARVWDPRDTNQNPDDETTWLWSQNAVLCALHYVRFYGAHEVPFERLPLEWWIAAINVCDEEAEFTDKDGNITTEPRYTTNGSFTFTTKPLDVLNQLEACFAGKIFRQMGQWYVRVGAWYGNPTYTINADDVHGNIKIKWHADLRDRANVVRATFTDPEQNYERTDAPPVISSAYQARDNQILEKSITLPFVRSSTTAQRLATIHLEQTRLGEIELPLKHKGLAAAVGRTVYLNLPGESITNKIYRVTERRFRLDGGVTLMCIEDGPGLWGDNLIPGAQDLTPNSDYLVGRPKPIFDVRVTIDGDGNGIVKWNHPTPLDVHEYDVEFIHASSSEPVFKTTVTYTQVTIPKLALGEYTARISARNIFGQRSDTVGVQFSVLTPSIPVVHVLADYNQITLTAELAAAGIGTQFEWEFLGTTAQPQSGERVLAQIYNRIGLKSETEYNFRVRSVNHLGSSAWVDVSATTTTVDLTEFINELPLTRLSEEAQNLINDINQQVDRLRPETEGNIPDLLDDTIKELNLERKARVDIEKGVLNLSASYTHWRQEYERRQLKNEKLIDAFVYVDPETGTIINRAYAYTDEAFSEASLSIEGLESSVTIATHRISQTSDRLSEAEARIEVQEARITSKASLTEVQGEIASAIDALRPAYSWQFNSSAEGFTGVDSHNLLGFIVATTPLTSPTINYEADTNPMFRLRVRRHTASTWNGSINVNNGTATLSIPEPIEGEWQTVQVDATGTDGYTGIITSLTFNLGQCDVDFIEVGKRGASDLALKDIQTRTTSLESDIDASSGRMAQYATTVWVKNEGYQTQSDIEQIIDSFNSTYKVSVTLQQFSDNNTLEKANNAQQFINGAEAYIKSQITAFNAGEGSVNAKFSNVEEKLDAIEGTINQSIVQIQGLELNQKVSELNDAIAAANEFIRNAELKKQGVKLAIAQTELKANADDIKSVASQTLELLTQYNSNFSAITELSKAFANEKQAFTVFSRDIISKIETDTESAKNTAISKAQEYTRTAIGYCLDADGNITSESDAVQCVDAGGSWVSGPLAEYIENLQITEGDQSASIKQLRQLFTTIDGKLVARGGWTVDNNGRVVGVAGYNDGEIANLDLVGDVIRQGIMVNDEFVPTSYVDNITDPKNPVHVFKGRMILGDGFTVDKEEDIRGLDGAQGPQGEQGVKGADGSSTYFHVAYADSADGSVNFNQSNGRYIGTYVDTNLNDSNDYSDYNWVKIEGSQGPKGDQGIKGINGENGETSYLHIAYADSADGSVNFNQQSGDYIGQYVDFIQQDSNDPSKYTWTKIVGAQGPQGEQGVKGVDGSSSYFHVAYADSADGSVNFNQSNGRYIGTYVDTNLNDSNDYSDYNWVKIEGSQGPKGDQGIKGINGENGETSYLHIAYADSADGSVNFNQQSGDYMGQYVDFIQQDSNDPAKYTWTKIVGRDGLNAENLTATQHFDFNGTQSTWNFIDFNVETFPTYISLQSLSTSARLIKLNANLIGSNNYVISMRLKCVSNTIVTSPKVFYSTATHGFDEAYHLEKNSITFKKNEWVTLNFDMRELTQGGTDWINNTISSIRIDLPRTSTSETLHIDWIAFGRFGPAEDGENGKDGAEGSRGSIAVDVATSSGAWSDSVANANVPGSPVIHDRVTIYKSSDPSIQTTKRFNGSSWVSYALQVHGSAIIDDTLDARAIRAGSRMESPRIDLIGTNFMKIELASGFGPENLWYWYGPKYMQNGLPDLSRCTRATATEWKDTNGNSFTRGSFIAGSLESSVTTSHLVNNPSRELEITSNGNTISFAVSYSHRRTHYGPTDGDSSSVNCPATQQFQPTSGTLYLERWNGSGWTVIQSQPFSGSYSCTDGYFEAEQGTPNVPYIASSSSNKSFTATHQPGSGYQKYRVRAQVNNFYAVSGVGQYLSLAASE